MALHIAATFGETKFALDAYQRCHMLVSDRNLKGDALLHIIMAKAGDLSVAQSLVNEIISESPLRLRDIENGELVREHDDVLRVLVEEKGTPLDVGLQTADIMRVLIDAEPEQWCCSNSTAGESSLHLAAREGFQETALHAAVIDRNLDADGRSLHEAIMNSHIYMVNCLLQHCPFCANLLEVQGQNDLNIVIKGKRLRVVGHILSMDELERLIKQQDKPLHAAAVNCYARIVMLFSFEGKVDMKAKNNKGLTAPDIFEQDYEQRRSIFQKFLVSRTLKLTKRCKPQLIGTKITGIQATTEAASSREYEEAASSRKHYKEMVNILPLVATLIATVTFAAALTMPLGYNSDDPKQDTAMLIRKATFKMFLFFDAMAFCSSISAMFLLVWMTIAEHEAFLGSIVFASVLTWSALLEMGLALVTGSYAVYLL